MSYQYNKLNIGEILKYTPTGTRLYSPEFGTLYLTHEKGSGDAIKKYSVGIDFIPMTKKEPPYDIYQFGGYGQYRYGDIDFLFDEYGNIIVYNHHRAGYNEPFLREGWRYTYNGKTFISDEGCKLFPDEECTWENWQLKLFKKGNLVKVRMSNDIKDVDETGLHLVVKTHGEINYVGYFTDTYEDCYGNTKLILSETVREIIEDRTVRHYYDGVRYVDLTENTTFATFQDSMEHSTNKDILLGKKKPSPFPNGYLGY
jgi:hypothetical protein